MDESKMLTTQTSQLDKIRWSVKNTDQSIILQSPYKREQDPRIHHLFGQACFQVAYQDLLLLHEVQKKTSMEVRNSNPDELNSFREMDKVS